MWPPPAVSLVAICSPGWGAARMGCRPRRRPWGWAVSGGTPRHAPVRATAVLVHQIRNTILLLLLGAALVSGLTGGGTNAVIVAASVGLGFFNEHRAEMAMAGLRPQIGARGDRHVVLGEHPADRLDPEMGLIGDDQRSLRSS